MDRENRYHVGVQNGRGRLGLASEPLSCRAADCQMRGEDFHRDQSLEFGLLALQHVSHAAPTNHLQDVDFTDPPDRVGRR